MPIKTAIIRCFEYYAGGQLYKITHPKGSYPSAFRINQNVRLTYEKNDPSRYEIDEELFPGNAACRSLWSRA